MRLTLLVVVVLLQGCALGALWESDVDVQPVLKPGSANSAQQSSANAHVNAAYAGAQTMSQATGVEPVSEVNINPVALDEVYADSSAELSYNTAPTTTSSGLAATYLQVGMFTSLAGAEQVRANTQAITEANVIIRSNQQGQHRVLVGPIKEASLVRVKSQLDAGGLSYFRHTE